MNTEKDMKKKLIKPMIEPFYFIIYQLLSVFIGGLSLQAEVAWSL
jgi:hypothetical protein